MIERGTDSDREREIEIEKERRELKIEKFLPGQYPNHKSG